MLNTTTAASSGLAIPNVSNIVKPDIRLTMTFSNRTSLPLPSSTSSGQMMEGEKKSRNGGYILPFYATQHNR